MPDKEKDTSQDETILRLARERFNIIQGAEHEIRAASLEDIRFTYNVDEGQWDADTRSTRERDKRPCLTANKLRKFVAVVANRERENRIGVKVVPVDDQADPDRAQIIQDLARNIEFQSEADVVYASSGEHAIAGGFGYWRVLTKFEDDSFDQSIFIDHIENPFAVYMHPRGRYAFIRDSMTQKEFEHQYPNASKTSFDYASLGEDMQHWYETDKIFVAEYFAFEPTTKEIAQIRNALNEVKIVELKQGITVEELTNQGNKVLKTRKVKTEKVMWYKMSGSEILERREWPGKFIPIVEVMGDMVNIAGKIYKRSLIRDGKDPQRMYNYWLTSMTEKVALVPKAPFIVTPSEIQGHESMWDEANEKNFPYLLVNPSGSNQRPERQQPAQIDTGAMAMLNISNHDIKDTLGMYESFTGEPSNERSGRAIRFRQQRSDLGTFHFSDNLRRAIVQTGRILIDLIPKIYDTERVIRLRNELGEETPVRINQTVRDEETGKDVILNDLSVGKYDVQADVRLYSTRRQETVQDMLDAMQYAPAIAPAIAPLVFKFSDSPAAPEILQAIQEWMGILAQQGNGGEGVPNVTLTR